MDFMDVFMQTTGVCHVYFSSPAVLAVYFMLFASFINQSTISAYTFCQSELKDSESANKIPLSFITVITTQYITTLNDCQLN